MLRHVKAQTAIYVVGLVIMILASATLYVVGGKVQELRTFLGWERVMFWLMIGLMIYSVFGCIANTCARARAGDATTTPTPNHKDWPQAEIGDRGERKAIKERFEDRYMNQNSFKSE